jgi:hypothetical protein
MWHDIRAKFHKDWYRRSRSIKVFFSEIPQAVVICNRDGRIYTVHR